MHTNRAKEDLLVISAQSGDRRAFESLFRMHNKALLRFAYRLCGDQTLATDAVQDAWLTLSQSLRKLRDPRGFRVWAYKTVRWRVTDGARKQNRMTSSLDDVAEIATEVPEPAATSGQLTSHLAALPENERQALALFYLDELKMAEIAGILGVPLGTVKSRLNRAKARLRQQMQGDTECPN